MENITQIANFVKGFEGCVLHPYLDSSKTPTIGWGCTYYPNGNRVTMADPEITQAEADYMFLEVLTPFIEGVCEAVGASISAETNKLVAMVDFAYNLGLGAFKQSVLLQHVLTNEVVEADFTIYDHVGTEVDADLLARRKAEYNLYITPIKTMEPTNVTQETPQVLTVSQVTVTYKTFVNGTMTEDSRAVDITVTPELCAALKASSLVAPGWNVEVTPQI